LLYKPNTNNQFYISFAKAHKEPNRTDFENGSPVPEVLDDLELGWRWKTDDAFLNTNIYFMSYKNQLVLTGAIDQVGAPIRANSGDSYRRGIELEGGWHITSNLNWQANVTWSKNRNKDKYFKRDDVLQSLGDTHLAFSPSMVASQQLTYTANNWSVSFVSKYVGEQYMGNIDAERSKLESYLINDIQVQALLLHNEGGPTLNLNVHLQNIFDELISSNGYFYTYDDDYSVPNVVTTVEGVGYYPQAGRHFMAGLTLQF